MPSSSARSRTAAALLLAPATLLAASAAAAQTRAYAAAPARAAGRVVGNAPPVVPPVRPDSATHRARCDSVVAAAGRAARLARRNQVAWAAATPSAPAAGVARDSTRRVRKEGAAGPAAVRVLKEQPRPDCPIEPELAGGDAVGDVTVTPLTEGPRERFGTPLADGAPGDLGGPAVGPRAHPWDRLGWGAIAVGIAGGIASLPGGGRGERDRPATPAGALPSPAMPGNPIAPNPPLEEPGRGDEPPSSLLVPPGMLTPNGPTTTDGMPPGGGGKTPSGPPDGRGDGPPDHRTGGPPPPEGTSTVTHGPSLVVPEPAGLTLLGAAVALGGLARWRVRRRP